MILYFQICGSSGCCKSKTFKHWASDDWSRGDTEVWGSRYFGDCSAATFDACEDIEVAIWKDAGDNLKVKRITLELAKVGRTYVKT